MKRLLFTLMILLLAFGIADARDTLTNPITQPPTLTDFVIFNYDLIVSQNTVQIWFKLGYDDAGDFTAVGSSKVCIISNTDIAVNGQIVHSDVTADMPAGTNDNPGSYLLAELNTGTFGGLANASAMMYYAVKNAAWCNQ